MNPCIYVNIALIIYIIRSTKSIVVILPKSIPPTCVTFFMYPVESSVIAFPNSFGPIIENVVDNVANIKITISFILSYYYLCYVPKVKEFI